MSKLVTKQEGTERLFSLVSFLCRQLKKNMAKRKRKRSRMRSGGSSNKPPVGIERDSEAQGLDGEAGPGGKDSKRSN